MGRTEQSEFRGAAQKREKRGRGQYVPVAPEDRKGPQGRPRLTEAQLAARAAWKAGWKEREAERVAGLKEAAEERKRDLEVARQQAARAAELERLTNPSEEEIKALLRMTEAELAEWMVRRVHQIGKLALAAGRPDFRAALTATLAIEDIVRRYRAATDGKSKLWLTEAIQEGEVEDDANASTGDGTGCVPALAGGLQEETGADEVALPPRGQDAESTAQPGDAACTGVPALAEPDEADGAHLHRGETDDELTVLMGGREVRIVTDPNAPKDGPDLFLNAADWSSIIAEASSSLTDICPACCQLGGLVTGRVLDGVQWLDCAVCGRTEVKRG